MLGGPVTILVVLPTVTALAIGWAVRDWGTALAVLITAVGCFLMVPVVGGFARQVSPIFTSAAISALTLVPLLLWRPDLKVWARMTAALATSFTAHFLFLQAVLGQI